MRDPGRRVVIGTAVLAVVLLCSSWAIGFADIASDVRLRTCSSAAGRVFGIHSCEQVDPVGAGPDELSVPTWSERSSGALRHGLAHAVLDFGLVVAERAGREPAEQEGAGRRDHEERDPHGSARGDEE